MRTHNGSFIISRSIFDSEIWLKPPEWLKIWIHILGNVNFQDNNLFKRGENLFRYDLIAIECRCSYKTVENCMKFLKDRNQIGITRTSRGAILSVNKYDEYQNIGSYQDSSRKQVGIKQESSSDSITEEGKNERMKEGNNTMEEFLQKSQSIEFSQRSVSEQAIIYFSDFDYIPPKDETPDTFRKWFEELSDKKERTSDDIDKALFDWHTYWIGQPKVKQPKSPKSSLANHYSLNPTKAGKPKK